MNTVDSVALWFGSGLLAFALLAAASTLSPFRCESEKSWDGEIIIMIVLCGCGSLFCVVMAVLVLSGVAILAMGGELIDRAMRSISARA